MPKLVECVPNFSEGRDHGVIEALCGAAGGAPGVALLDFSADRDHNRSVFTLLGSPEGVAEAAFRMCAAARDMIDMNSHTGGHPRVGATDVIPFVPIRGCDMGECVGISVDVARRIAGELQIPCFLYEESCTREERRNLADIRRGGFEGMAAKLLLDDWAPDFGGRAVHPTAGVSVVGARKPLIAFNVNLGVPDLKAAKDIAKAVRGSDGGLAHCKAIGVMLADRGVAQVSMNLTDYEKTPPHVAYEAVCAEAARRGVPVAGSEIVGLVPSSALAGGAKRYFKLENFDERRQLLENRILEYV